MSDFDSFVFVSCQQFLFIYLFCGRFDEKQDLRICTVRDPDNLPSSTPVWLIFGTFAQRQIRWMSQRWMNAREEAASFSTQFRGLALLRDANRSLGGCWWRPWLKPSVIQMDHGAKPNCHPSSPAVEPRPRPPPGGHWRTRSVPAMVLWFTRLRRPQRRRAAPCSLLPCDRASCGPCAWIPPCVSTPPLFINRRARPGK